jgi:hypothetical protein
LPAARDIAGQKQPLGIIPLFFLMHRRRTGGESSPSVARDKIHMRTQRGQIAWGLLRLPLAALLGHCARLNRSHTSPSASAGLNRSICVRQSSCVVYWRARRSSELARRDIQTRCKTRPSNSALVRPKQQQADLATLTVGNDRFNFSSSAHQSSAGHSVSV